MTDITEPAPAQPTVPGTIVPAQGGPADPPGPVDPWAVRTVLLETSDAQARERRLRRRGAVLRWGAAVLIAAVTGTAAALGVTAPDRTDLPGLATPNDGRYAFPQLQLPPLPSGRPVPSESAAAGRHFADLRQLILPPPRGAVPQASSAAGVTAGPSAAPASSAPAPASAGGAGTGVPWAAWADFAADQTDQAKVASLMTEYGCRDAVRRAWTAADGTRTEIWLFRFGTRAEATGVYEQLFYSEPKGMPPLSVADFTLDRELKDTSTLLRQSDEKGGGGAPTTRLATFSSGDVAGTVLMTDPKGVPVQAFRQTTLLQVQLLR